MNSAIIEAIEARNADEVRAILSGGFDPRARFKYIAATQNTWMQCSALHVAAQNGAVDIIELLLSAGAGIDVCDKYGSDEEGTDTPLSYAVAARKPAAVEALLKHGSEVSVQDVRHAAHREFDASPVADRVQTMELLLERYADVNAVDKVGFTPLYWACWDHQNGPVVELLLEHGADVNVRTDSGESALHMACQHHQGTQIVEVLLEHGADPAARDQEESTPLHKAVEYNAVQSARLLLRHGAAIGSKNRFKDTPLKVALRPPRNSAMVLLLMSHCNPLVKLFYMLLAWSRSLGTNSRQSWSLQQYAKAVVRQATNRDPNENFGLYKREEKIRQLGEEINTKWGFEGMQQAWDLVKADSRFDGMGGFAGSALTRIWNGVGKWQS